MQVEIIQLDKHRSADREIFSHFPRRFYEQDPWGLFHLAKTDSMLLSQETFEIYVGKNKTGEIIGRMAVGKNEELKDENGIPYGYIGLFEIIEDFDCFCQMLAYAKDVLRKQGIGSALFPFFISTYFPYRYTARGRDLFSFFLEYPDQPHYTRFAQKSGLEVVYPANSFLDRDLDRIIEKNRRQYDKTKQAGYTVKSFDRGRPESELKILYELSRKAFSNNPYYTEISYERFAAFYKDTLKILDPEFLRITFDENRKPVGFSFSVPDLIRSPVKGVILKSVAVLPEYRQRGVLGTWTYLDAHLARERGYEYVIGAFVPGGNISKKVLTPDTLMKDHELYCIRP